MTFVLIKLRVVTSKNRSLLVSERSSEGCMNRDCLGDLGDSCNKTRLGLSVLFLWVIILTIVCIVLGSNIGKKHFIFSKTRCAAISCCCHPPTLLPGKQRGPLHNASATLDTMREYCNFGWSHFIRPGSFDRHPSKIPFKAPFMNHCLGIRYPYLRSGALIIVIVSVPLQE